MIRQHRASVLAIIFCSSAVFSQEEQVDYAQLSGLQIRNIVVEAGDVFDTSDEEESNFLFEAANRFHVNTRPSTLTSQLLFREGDAFSAQRLAESERILRNNSYLYDASITPITNDDGTLDLLVETRDNWTLFPEFKFSRSGGDSETSYGIEEQNLLGTGTRLNIRQEKDKDRTSSVFEFSGQNLGDHRLSVAYSYSDLSDGESQLLRVQRPFFSLDTHWAAGFTHFADDRINSFYEDGERIARYRQDQTFSSLFYGISGGLKNSYSRRWIAGFVADERDYEAVIEPELGALAPESRELNYPYIRYQEIEDRYAKTENLNQISRTEDIYLGRQLQFTLGQASSTFGADRDAWLLDASYQQGFGSPKSLLILTEGSSSMRVESGGLRNLVVRNRTEFYYRQSPKRVLYAATFLRLGKDLDLDNFVTLGGDTGLRGYPTNYLNAERAALVTLEQRFYTDYYPLRLYRVGAAIFFDAARGWGDDLVGQNDHEELLNVGFGLRFASTRSGNNRVFHVDLAFPMNRRDEVDSYQFQITGKRRF